MSDKEFPLRGAWIEIDLGALLNNLRIIRGLIGKNTLLMPVVKADAYGHGIVRCAQALAQGGADRFAVATLEEGVRLREAGIQVPILCLGYLPPRQYEAALDYNLALTVFNEAQAVAISALAVRMNKEAVVHIKVDSGFTRLGFMANEDAASRIEAIKKLPSIRLEAVFSHFAAADFADKSFSHYQNANFSRFIELCEKKGVTFPLRHIANSAAIIDLPQYQYEICRPGIILFGCQPSTEIKPLPGLRPVMSVRAEIARLMWVPAGTAVGYGCTWVAPRESLIATIPLGYADGISRLLNSHGQATVLVKGRRAPVNGQICMDQFMIDVTDVQSEDSLHEGDIITVLGQDGQDMITAEELGERMGTINYEILCLLGNRLPRVYII